MGQMMLKFLIIQLEHVVACSVLSRIKTRCGKHLNDVLKIETWIGKIETYYIMLYKMTQTYLFLINKD